MPLPGGLEPRFFAVRGRFGEGPTEFAGRSSAHPTTARLLFEALDEPLEHAHPDLVLADLVLDAVLEIGIVVDLHDDEAAVGLLDVDAVEPLPDRPRRAHRDVDQRSRRLVELESAEATFARGAVGAVLDDLPM